MKYLSLFSGIGGFELGIQQAYEDIISEKQIQIQRDKSRNGTMPNNKSRSKYGKPSVCVGYSEIDKYAIQIYEKHFNHKNYGDITKIIAKELPDFDLIVGGFPCQSFSIAGKRLGFKDTRGTLFFDIARIIKEKRPKYLLLENVKGLLSHDDGNTFRTILSTLTEMGYDLQWQVLNSKNFGVPQNRERVFIIGHLRGTARPKVFPFGETGKENNKRSERKIRVINQQTRSKDRPSLKYSSGGFGMLCKDDEAFCLPTTGGSGQFIQRLNSPKDSKIRRLTPIECERLQGFPDNWTEGLSDTQRYKTLGNAVTVNVIREIAKRY